MSLLPAKHEGQGLGTEDQGPNNRTLALLCRTALIISHAVKKSVKPHEIGYVYVKEWVAIELLLAEKALWYCH